MFKINKSKYLSIIKEKYRYSCWANRVHKIFKIIIGYSASFFTKLVLFYRHTPIHIFYIISIPYAIINVKKNNDLLLYQDI